MIRQVAGIVGDMRLFTIGFAVILAMTVSLSCGESDSASNDKPRDIPADAPSSDKPIADSGIKWRNWDDGMMEVVGTPKFAIVYFDTIDCAPCMWMEDSLWSNPEIIERIEKEFVPIKVQSHRDKQMTYQGREFTESELRKIFFLPGYPMTLFLSGAKNEFVGGQPSIIRPQRMQHLMTYITSGAYKAVEFDEYLRDMGLSVE